MRVLLVGGGGREHALAWKLAQSPHVTRLYAAPGNPGIAEVAECVPIAVDAVSELARLATRERIALTIVGPELPLALGIVDHFAEQGLPAFGPTRAAAELESSKIFAKQLFARYGIPTARFGTFEDPVKAREFARGLGGRAVVKADGLAAGKGAVVCRDLPSTEQAIGDMLERRVFGAAGARIVVEEFLEGEEVSLFALTDGHAICPLGAAQDHKAVFDDDRGPNTGGMGAYSPPPVLGAELTGTIVETVLRPTVEAMRAEGRLFRGVLYAGLMLTREGPKLLEYNVRHGDPECQALMVRLAGDLLPLCRAVAEGAGLPPEVAWRPEAAVCVVLASGGYPGSYATGHAITGIEAAARHAGVSVFHAGTAVRDGRLVTAGGRVLGVTARGPDIPAAIEAAYAAVAEIRFEGMHYRRDIGRRASRRLGRPA
ncbi:MAG TPA: phosphoribosylamine--glycine ligase [Methylomirabilota bacterium]|jgi:phosphoribosylamine--glycine ligase|nr:phosphoribosylamine--glycine ligase [Methylomirabilota bacterium]